MTGAAAGKRVVEALKSDPRPKLCLWADSDPIIPPKVGARFAAAIGAPEPEIIAEASHFPAGGCGRGDRGQDRRLARVLEQRSSQKLK